MKKLVVLLLLLFPLKSIAQKYPNKMEVTVQNHVQIPASLYLK